MGKFIDNIKQKIQDFKDLKRDKATSMDLTILKQMESEGIIERDKSLYDDLGDINKRGDTYGAVWSALGAVMVNGAMSVYGYTSLAWMTDAARAAVIAGTTAATLVGGYLVSVGKDASQTRQLRQNTFALHHTVFRDVDKDKNRDEIIYSMYVKEKYERGKGSNNHEVFLHITPAEEIKMKEAAYGLEEIGEFLGSVEHGNVEKKGRILVRYDSFKEWSQTVYGVDPDNPHPQDEVNHSHEDQEPAQSITQIIDFAEHAANRRNDRDPHGRDDAMEI